MKEALGYIAAIVGGSVLVLGLTWAFQGNDFFLYKTFAPKYESARRETFEQSRAYREGMAQELERMQFEYEQADDDHKKALASIILHRVADFDTSGLSPDTRGFIRDLKAKRGGR